MTNSRLHYPVYAVGIAPLGSTTYVAIHGLQQAGMTTRFNLEHVFEIGQISEYSAIENVPDVELQCEKVFDGYPYIYHLATEGATDASLAGRATKKCMASLSYFTETQNAASGTPLKQVVLSGMFPSALTYTFPVQGNCTESCTLVGNNKVWQSSAFTFTGGFTDTDAPPSGIQRRQHVLLGSGAIYSLLPTDLPGISNVGGSGWNVKVADVYGAHISSIRVSTNLGRTPLYELGRRGPYFRTVDFPTEVKTDIEMYDLQGDLVDALEESDNISNERIVIKINDGSQFDLGTRNKLTSVAETGGNAGTGGGNRTITFSYTNFNNLTITAPHDVSGL